MDRHVIATWAPSSGRPPRSSPPTTRSAASSPRQGREDDFTELVADDDATYDVTETIDLSSSSR
jgi:aconitate hydratase